MIHKKVQKHDGPYLDVTDFTFTKSEGAQVPFAYAADCKLKPAVSSYSLHGTNLRYLKEIKTFIGHIGSAVRNSLFSTLNCTKKVWID